MERMPRSIAGAALLVLLTLSGCGARGPILVDFRYQPSAGFTPDQAPRISVAVTPFKDERGKTESVAGKRFNAMNDHVNDLVVQGTVSDKITAGFKTALRLRDIPVNESATWDQTEAGIPAAGNLVLSGQIKTFWLESISAFGNTKVSARVELRVVVADTAQKKIVRAVNVSSSLERQNVVYATSFVQATMTEALTAAINQVFNDQELKKLLK